MCYIFGKSPSPSVPPYLVHVNLDGARACTCGGRRAVAALWKGWRLEEEEGRTT